MTKKVALIPDVKNWAWWNRAEGIRKYASPEYEVHTILESNFRARMARKFDGTLAMSWSSFCDEPPDANRTWVMVASGGLMHDYDPSRNGRDYWQRSASRSKNRKTAMQKLGKFRGVITINPLTLDFCKSCNPNTVLLRPGVDTDFFHPVNPVVKPSVENKLRIGWCAKSFDDPKMWTPKGYHEVLLPLQKEIEIKHPGQVEWIVNRRHHGNRLSAEEMRDWYNSIDLLLITSSYEGTPSTLLEAAACGRGFVSTNVGIAKDVVTASFTKGPTAGAVAGLVSPSYRDIKGASGAIENLADDIEYCINNRDCVTQAGNSARATIEEHYSWKNGLANQWLKTITS